MPVKSMKEILADKTRQCLRLDAPLAERLAALAGEVNSLSPEFTSIVERMIGRLQSSGAGLSAPGSGKPIVPFVLPDQDGNLVALEMLLKRGPLVLSFHRGGWCPYCRISADALARHEPEIKAIGGHVAVVTPDVEQWNSELKSDIGASFPILTDLDNGYALQMNLAISIPDDKRQAMIAAGWDIANTQSNNCWILPIPATFVVGRDGIVKASYVDPDYRKRMTIEAIMEALEDCQRQDPTS